MTDWVQCATDEPKHFEGVAEVGFGWPPRPGNYRSRAAIEGREPYEMHEDSPPVSPASGVGPPLGHEHGPRSRWHSSKEAFKAARLGHRHCGSVLLACYA
jgi:hypothetical protein